MEALVMSKRERRRLELFSRVREGELTLVKASELLQLSYRQAKRSYGRYRSEGDRGVVHRLRGRASNRGVDPGKKARIWGLYREKYADFGPTLSCEYLAKEDELNVGVETLRQWLIAEGLWSFRRRRPVHRKWRERKGHFGEMVQLDGSHHDWFEGRRGKAVLMVLIDDATNRTYAVLRRRDDGSVVRDVSAVRGPIWFAAIGVCGSGVDLPDDSGCDGGRKPGG